MSKELFNKLYSNLVVQMKNEFISFNVRLDEKKDDEFVVDYMNWRRRFISKRERKVFYSKEISKNKKYGIYKKSIEKIAYKFRKGNDLTSFLSKGIVDNPYKANSRRDKDIFLNAFGIHHLHLGMRGNKVKYGINFVERNDDLLYVMIKNDKVYFIDIDVHNFGNLNLFRIVKNNWEYLLSEYELKGIEPSKEEISDEVIEKLIQSGVSVPIEIDNKVYSVCNLVTSGHAGMWMFDFESLIIRLKQTSFMLIFNYMELKNKIESIHSKSFNSIEFNLVIKSGYIYLVEESSSSTIVINWQTSQCEIYKGYCIDGMHSIDINY